MIKLDSLSSEAQADIADLFGKGSTTPESEDSTAVDETEEVESDEEPDSDDSKPDEEADEVDNDEDDSGDEDTQASDPDIEYIKANGKKVKIDFNDRENIKRVFSMAAGARQWQAERDSLKTENTELTKKHGELKEVLDYLEDIKDDHETLFEAVSGTSLQDKFREWADEQNLIGGMSESEKTMYLSNQDHQKRIQDVEKREKTLQGKLDAVTARDEEAKIAQQASIANPIYFKYNFDNELGNSQLEHRMNRALWSEAKTELSAFDTVTPDMIEETFSRISNQIRAGFKSNATKAAKNTINQKRKEVKAEAQKMAVKEPKQNRRQEIEDKLKAGDLAGLLSGNYDLSNY